jgi:glucose-6-phosphate 1-dehydrogenase
MNSEMIGQTLEAVERLILQAMRAGHALIKTADGIELARGVSARLLEVPPRVRSHARCDPNRRPA